MVPLTVLWRPGERAEKKEVSYKTLDSGKHPSFRRVTMSAAMMLDVWFFLTGITLGALGMYLLDPERGQRRRTMLRARFLSQLDRLNAHRGAGRYGRQHRKHEWVTKVLR